MTERDIFLAVLDLPDPAARAAYIDAACGGDAARRARVEALIRSHEAAGSFLAEPAVVAPEPGQAATRTLRPDDGESPTNDEETLGFLAPPQRPDSLGRIGHYEVLEVLGRGGFGIVFRAFDEMLQRVVAVKVLAPAMAATSPARKRFLREARSSAQIRHENVVQVYAVEEQPLPYLVMEFIPGETLQQRLDRTGPLEVAELLRIGRQVAEGLAAAHAQGLVHRDIKPANVMIEGGGHERVKLTDFGLARAADDASISHSGVVAGTPMYMAPEQAKGESLDHRADLFSLGSVLYVMASGRPPFRASTTLAVLKRVAEEDPRPIREIIPEVPEWLCRVVEKLHAKNPDERFQSAREVAALLRKYLAQIEAREAVSPPPFSRPTPARSAADRGVKPWIRRRWKAVLLAIVLGFLAWRSVPHLVLMARDRAEIRFAAQDVPGAELILTGNGQQYRMEHGGDVEELEILPGSYAVEFRPAPGHIVTEISYYHQTLFTGQFKGKRLYKFKELNVGRGDRVVLVASMTTVRPEPAVHADAVRPLRDLVAAKERERNMVKARFDAGTVNPLDMLSAEVEFTTACLRLAEAERDKEAIVARLEELVGHRKEERRIVAVQVEVGAAAPDALDKADGRLAEAQAQLAKARSASDGDTDQAKIQGTWTGVSADRQGQRLPDLVMKAIGPTVTFADNKVTWKANPTPEGRDLLGRLLAEFSLEGVFHIDPTKSPKTIDLTVLGANATTPIGRPAPRALLGIYRLNGDSLEMCIAVDPEHAAERPTRFESVPGKAISHMKLRRRPPAEAGPDPGWVPLFNGRDLTGWKTHPDQPGDWHVENGILIGRGPRSHLFSERGDYEDFHIRVEAQINNRGNSGVYFRSEYGLGWGIHPKGYEAQIFEGDAQDPYKTGSLYSLAKVTSDLVKPNTWFTLEVTAQGNRTVIKVDGKMAVDFVDEAWRYKKGHFALQVERPGTIVQFRKIEVQELTDRRDTEHAPASTTSVSGTITQRGFPLPGGTVIFHFADRRSFSGKIRPDGAYRIELPEGVAGVAKVTVAEVPPPAPGHSLLKKVSSRYRDPEKSGLSCNVERPNQTFNIELNDIE